jgi:hypothetical protein
MVVMTSWQRRASECGSEVATFNQRHFAQVNGLTLIEPK